MKNPELWARLQAFDFDEGAAFSFAARLARENGWNRVFAERVLEEYRRFLYLACEAGHPVTPSDEVDQAWHLHLTYSRSYWERLCPDVLRQKLHHEPTRGGKSEGEKFEDWYARTLGSYEREFGETAPREIWPDSPTRFGRAPLFRRVNLGDVWVLKKPRASQKRAMSSGALLILAFALAGCAAVGSDFQSAGLNVFNWHGPSFLLFFWSLCVACLWGAWRARQIALAPDDANFPVEPLGPYEIARLKRGDAFAVDVALSTLLEKNAATLDERGRVSALPFEGELAPLERELWTRMGTGMRSENLRALLLPAIRAMDRKLENAGLLMDETRQLSVNSWPIAAFLFLLAIGGLKIIVGLERARPVGFLVLTCLVLGALFVWLLSRTPRLTGRGEKLLREVNRRTAYSVEKNADPALYFALGGAMLFPFCPPPRPNRQFGSKQNRNRDSGCGTTSFVGGSGCGSSGGDGGGGGDSGGSGCGGGGCGGGGCGGCGGS